MLPVLLLQSELCTMLPVLLLQSGPSSRQAFRALLFFGLANLSLEIAPESGHNIPECRDESLSFPGKRVLYTL